MTDSKSCADDGCMKMVEVRYDYSYKSDSDQKNVSFKVGEEYYLVVKTSENWWYVKKHLEDQQGVYVPAQYVKEVKTKKPKKVVPPISAPVSEGKPSLKSPPKLAQSKSQLDTTPSLNKGAIEELDKLLDDLKVPEAFQDAEQTPPEAADRPDGDRTAAEVHQSPSPPAENPVPSEMPKKSPSDCQSKEETRVESETSDYKTDSRESLDSEERGFETGEEKMSGVKVMEEVVVVDKGSQDVAPSRPVLKSESMDDYANLEEIQKAIRSRAAPPLAENLLPQGYCKPYQDQFNSSQTPSKRVEELAASTNNETTTPTEETRPREPQWDRTGPDRTASSPGGGDELSPQSLRGSKILLQPKMVDKQGSLQKAKVEENSKKMKKSWSQSYVILCQNLLYFYKDMKSSSSTKPRSINSLGKPELIVDLDGSKISSAPEDKNIKKDAFMLITTTKTHLLLFHEDPDSLLHWRQSIQNNISALEAGLVPNATGSLGKNKPDLLHSSCDLIESKQTIAERLKKFLLRRPTKESITKKGIYKEVTFGSSLVAICEREKGKVPRFVKECVLAIEERGLTVDGLYRVSGNVAAVQKLRSMVDHNEYYDLHDATWDVHTVTGALKLFFRELAEPLFTFKHFQSFLAALNNLNALKDLIKHLPTVHQKTMKFLFKHFTKVLENSRDNRMNVQGMAIVFGPTLLWPENASKDSNLALSLMQQGQLVEFVINNCKTLFG